jgi:hypothetical protein
VKGPKRNERTGGSTAKNTKGNVNKAKHNSTISKKGNEDKDRRK